MKPELNYIIEGVQATQKALIKYGTTDSEPEWFLDNLMRLAVAGAEFPAVRPEQWQLFSSVPGWEEAANKLTAAAKQAHSEIQNSKAIDVIRLAQYYGWKIS